MEKRPSRRIRYVCREVDVDDPFQILEGIVAGRDNSCELQRKWTGRCRGIHSTCSRAWH
jgi:hypothetical protein